MQVDEFWSVSPHKLSLIMVIHIGGFHSQHIIQRKAFIDYMLMVTDSEQ